MSYSETGTVYDPKSFADHIAKLDLSWAKSITIHHTGAPDLSQRPKGWTIQHMRNLENYYAKEMKWKAGPHLFTDEDQTFGLSPLTSPGTHAKSFNSTSIGIEMLGNYDHEDPMAGRGFEVLNNTAVITAALLMKMKLPANNLTILFHREDPLTTKTCPGRKIDKAFFMNLVKAKMVIDTTPPAPAMPALTLESLESRIRKLEQAAAAANFP